MIVVNYLTVLLSCIRGQSEGRGPVKGRAAAPKAFTLDGVPRSDNCQQEGGQNLGIKITAPSLLFGMLINNLFDFSRYRYAFNRLGGSLTFLVPQGITSRSTPMPNRSNCVRVD